MYKVGEQQIEVRAGVCDTLAISLIPIHPTPSFQGIFSTDLDTITIDPKDFAKYPKSSFGFRLSEDWSGNVTDTFTGTVTKDLGAYPDTTIPLVFTDKELDRIYRKALKVRLFELPEPSPQILTEIEQPSHIHLKVRAGSVVKYFEWDPGSVPAPAAETEWKGLGELLGLITKIVARRPEYYALPEPRYLM